MCNISEKKAIEVICISYLLYINIDKIYHIITKYINL